MSRRLFALGALLLLVTVGLWLAGAVDFIPDPADDRWSRMTLEAGLAALGGALLLRLLHPIAGIVRQGRCAVCGHPTQRGHTYCLDHQQEAVNAYRDKTHEATLRRPRSPRSSS